MEFSLDPGNASYRIEAYDQNGVTVNGQQYHQPMVVMPEHLILPWQIASIDVLQISDFEEIVKFKPQVILLGTGEELHFPTPDIYQYLAQQGIGLETMTSAAACRTYGVLMSEGREVAVALYFN